MNVKIKIDNLGRTLQILIKLTLKSTVKKMAITYITVDHCIS